MKSAIWKSAFREIRQSLGRFLAILAIVALGVGFFAGLKITQTAMVKTTERYFSETDFYDYHLLSNVGFSEESAETFAGQDGVKAAEGTVSFDILCGGSSGEIVIKALSIPEKVNRLVLTEGRMPEKDTECVADSSLYDSSAIGTKIKLSPQNEEEDLEHFTYMEYEITGLVQSPLYIQYERGSTSLGTGKVSGFLYLLPAGFQADYCTDIYVRFREDFPLYSDRYAEYIDAKTDSWEELAQNEAKARYEALRSDAEQQLSDAKQELEEKKEEAEARLAEAKEELDRAEAEIGDGEQKIKEAREQLEKAPEEIKAKEAQLADSEAALAGQEAALAGQEAALAGQEAAPAGQEAQLEQAKQQIAGARLQLEQAKQQLEQGRAAIAQAKEQLETGKKELEAKEKEWEEGKAEYEKGKQAYEEARAEFQKEVAEAEEKIADGEKEIAELEEPESYVLGRNANVGYACFESDSGIVDGIANVFPIFFFLVAALVCMTTMNRMVEEQRGQIGILKALGYGQRSIMAKYIFYSGTAALCGCAAGFFGGILLFPQIIWQAYGMMYQVAPLLFVFDAKLALISLAGSLLCSVGTTYVSCRYELSEVAAELMRPKAPRAGKRVFLEYLPFFWKRLKFLQKVSLRNIFRYKKRFFMMIAGISGCSALLLTGFGVRDSVTNVAEQQYTEIQLYDISLNCRKTADKELQRELEQRMPAEIAAYGIVSEETVDLEADGKRKSIHLVSAESGETIEPFLNLHTLKKESVPYPGRGEAVISHKIAQEYGIQKGDAILLRDEEQKEMKVKVSGIFQNFVDHYVYVTEETYEAQMGEPPERGSVYINAAEGQDVRRLGTELRSIKNVASVNVNEDFLERFSSMMKSMDLIVLVVIVSAAGLAFIVLYNLTNINITERLREIATIKVLGFYENETSAYVFRENLILTFLGALLGLVLGRLLHAFVMGQINIDLITFDTRILPMSYLYSVLLSMVFALLVNRMMKKKIDGINMTESLKSVD